MKKLFLAVALFLGLGFGSFAQNRSIAFEETKVWKEIIEKAKTEKKLIFVDCYTDWCPPCKDLTANVFTKDKVADFFNKNFVNAHFEMEKDAEAVILKKYQIEAYPTLLFVDPVTEKVVHRLVGARKAEVLIENGRQAIEHRNNVGAMIERYESGDRKPEFIAELLTTFENVYTFGEKTVIVMDYLGTLTPDQFFNNENWLLLKNYVKDPLSKPFREVMANRQKFYAIAGQETVDDYLTKSIMDAVEAVAIWNNYYVKEFDTARNTELTRYLQNIDFPATALAFTYLETAEIVRKDDWKGLIKKIREVDNSNVYPDEQAENYFNFFIPSLEFSDDKSLISEGLKMIDEKMAKIGEDDYDFRKSCLLYNKYILYMAIDDVETAWKARVESDEYLEKSGYIID